MADIPHDQLEAFVNAKIDDAILPLKLRIANLVRAGTVKRVNDGDKGQKISPQVLKGEEPGELQTIGMFGFDSNAPEGSECLVIRIGANADHAIVISTGNRTMRPKTESGYSTQYDKDGQTIRLKSGGIIEIDAEALGVINLTQGGVAASASLTLAEPLVIFLGLLSTWAAAVQGAAVTATTGDLWLAAVKTLTPPPTFIGDTIRSKTVKVDSRDEV